MNPDLAKKLMSDVPEMRQFVAYVQSEIAKLDRLSDIVLSNHEQIAIAVEGRKVAVQTLATILQPLLDIDDRQLSTTENEYGVDVK